MEKFKSEQKMVNYLCEKLEVCPNVAIVVEKEQLDKILDSISFESKSFEKEINSEYYTYVIDKYIDDFENIHVCVNPIEFDEDAEMIGSIENDMVIVVDYLLDGEDREHIAAYDGLIIVDYMTEEEINDECYYEEKEDNEALDEFLENEVQDFIELLKENSEDPDFCLHCELKQILSEIYELGHEDGVKSLALGLGDMLSDVIEEY